jgi:hypothetical protein
MIYTVATKESIAGIYNGVVPNVLKPALAGVIESTAIYRRAIARGQSFVAFIMSPRG